ncbi:MAG: metalloregulator ArsR/SmtB family transcription factor [Nocardioides sp.]|nr:metalloregulator ArsR/SmtB family transcription factor [Nocardioides sp.]
MDAFAALADPVRRDLVRRLATGPARVVDLATDHPISRPAISRHLRLLVDADIAIAEDRGRERHYRLSHAGLEPVQAFLVSVTPVDESSTPPFAPPFAQSDLDGLDLEVRRTVKEWGVAADRRDESRQPSKETG